MAWVAQRQKRMSNESTRFDTDRKCIHISIFITPLRCTSVSLKFTNKISSIPDFARKSSRDPEAHCSRKRVTSASGRRQWGNFHFCFSSALCGRVANQTVRIGRRLKEGTICSESSAPANAFQCSPTGRLTVPHGRRWGSPAARRSGGPAWLGPGGSMEPYSGRCILPAGRPRVLAQPAL